MQANETVLASGDRSVVLTPATRENATRMLQSMQGAQLALPGVLPDSEEIANAITNAVQGLTAVTVDKGKVAAMSSAVEVAVEFTSPEGLVMSGVLKISLKARQAKVSK